MFGPRRVQDDKDEEEEDDGRVEDLVEVGFLGLVEEVVGSRICLAKGLIRRDEVEVVVGWEPSVEG